MSKIKKVVTALVISIIIMLNIPVFAVNNVKNTNTSNTTNSNIVKEKIELKSLYIEGKNLEPSYSKDTHQYTVSIEGEETSLNIIAEPNETNTKVAIIGNENLVDGQNIVTIMLTDEKETNINTYQIYVNKNVVSKDGLKNLLDTSQIKKIIKIGIVAFIALIILIFIVAFVKIKHKKSNRKDKKIENTVQNEDIERQRRIQAINERISKQYEKENKRNKKNGKHSK